MAIHTLSLMACNPTDYVLLSGIPYFYLEGFVSSFLFFCTEVSDCGGLLYSYMAGNGLLYAYQVLIPSISIFKVWWILSSFSNALTFVVEFETFALRGYWKLWYIVGIIGLIL